MAAPQPIDGRRASTDAAPAGTVPGTATPATVHPSDYLSRLDLSALQREYRRQGAFLVIPDFLPAAVTAELIESIDRTEPALNRNYLPGHKQGGSVSRYSIDRLAPKIAELYRSPPLI